MMLKNYFSLGCFWLSFIFLMPQVKAQSFQQTYPESFRQAVDYCETINTPLQKVASKYALKSEELIPIVFPECARYRIFQDQIETTALQVLYINFGEAYADFSIGHFQMKPSFIEQLEEFVSSHEEMQGFGFIANYEGFEDPQEVRRKRLRRMVEEQWQLEYLCCVFKALELIHQEESFDTENDRLLFFATAYNCGFLSNQQRVKSWMQRSYFPEGEENEWSFSYHQVSHEYLKLKK